MRYLLPILAILLFANCEKEEILTVPQTAKLYYRVNQVDFDGNSEIHMAHNRVANLLPRLIRQGIFEVIRTDDTIFVKGPEEYKDRFDSNRERLTLMGCEDGECTWVRDLVLPIKVSEFSVKRYEQGDYITIKTSSEVNADYMMLQCSTDGKAWEDVKKIKLYNSPQGATYTYLNER